MADHRYSVEILAPCLIVRQVGTLEDLPSMRRMQAAIELQKQQIKATGALFDNRRTGIHDDAIRKAMWAWVTGAGFSRVALLLESELSVVRANMDAVAKRATLKAFARESDAIAWLRADRAPHDGSR